ncbi:hypothetical protein HEN55_011045 [Escherichia coli]|nr:hypothetical protein [Escherichia coli]
MHERISFMGNSDYIRAYGNRRYANYPHAEGCRIIFYWRQTPQIKRKDYEARENNNTEYRHCMVGISGVRTYMVSTEESGDNLKPKAATE